MSSCLPHLGKDADVACSRFATLRVSPLSDVLPTSGASEDRAGEGRGVAGRQDGAGGVSVSSDDGIYAFAGLGCPKGFFESVSSIGGSVLKSECRIFPILLARETMMDGNKCRGKIGEGEEGMERKGRKSSECG
jgi:hypothetical protein